MEFVKKIVNYFIGQGEDDNCPVCFEVMTNCWITSRRVTLEPCKHQFCQKCVKTIWHGLRSNEKLRCPLCRQNAEVDFTLSSIFIISYEQERLLLFFPWIMCFLTLLMMSIIFVLLVIIWMGVLIVFWQRFRRILGN